VIFISNIATTKLCDFDLLITYGNNLYRLNSQRLAQLVVAVEKLVC